MPCRRTALALLGLTVLCAAGPWLVHDAVLRSSVVLLVVAALLLARRTATVAADRERAALRDVLDALPDVVFARDARGRFVFVNEQAGRFFGRDVAELPGLHVADVYPDAALAQRWLDDDRHVLAHGGTDHDDVEYRDAAGEPHWLHIKKRLLTGGLCGGQLVLGIGTDITERKRAELAMAKQLAVQDMVARTLAVLVRCERGRFPAAMEEALRNVAGMCRAGTAIIYRIDWHEERVTQLHAWRAVVADQPPTYPLDLMRPAITVLDAGGAFSFTDPAELPPHAAALADVARSAGVSGALFVPVFRDGRLWGVLGVYRWKACAAWTPEDEALLRALADILIGAHARHEAEEQVRAAMRAAQAADRAKSEFLANMSHEIRTPLNAVIGLTDVLQQLEPRAEQQHYLQMIHGAGQTLLGLVNNVLDLSRIESGEVTLEQRPFAPAAAAREVVQVMTVAAQHKAIALTLRVDDDVPAQVLGDRLRVQQILMNLLGNAIKFTERGAVVLTVRRTEAGLGLRVADTGIGIPADKLSTIFEAFTQADASHTRRYGGTGLGLAISRRLAAIMGGAIEVESAVGVGSAFTVSLPLPTATAPEPAVPGAAGFAAASSVVDGTGAPLRVLLAEDNPVNQKVATTLLRTLGCDVTVVPDGRQAVAAVATGAFELVFMDCQMPEMDGLEATRVIRALGGSVAAVPVVALTANVLAEHQQACSAAGMNDFVSKPVNRAALRAILEKWAGSEVLNVA